MARSRAGARRDAVAGFCALLCAQERTACNRDTSGPADTRSAVIGWQSVDGLMRDSLLEMFHHPLAKKAYTFAAVVFAVAALASHTTRRLASRFARTLASGTRGVTTRLSAVERQHIAALAAVIMLITSSLGGVGLSSTDKASAASTEWVYVGDADGNLAKMDVSDGSTDWSVSLGGGGNLDVAYYDGYVYALTPDSNFDPTIYKIDPSDGSVVDSKTTSASDVIAGIDVSEGNILVGFASQVKIYNSSLDQQLQKTYGNTVEGVAIDSSQFVVGTNGGGHTAYDLDGNEQYSAPTGFARAAALDGDTYLYAGDAQNNYFSNDTSGATRFSKTNSLEFNEGEASGSFIAFGTGSNTVAYDTSGNEQWSAGSLSTGLTIDSSRVITGSGSNGDVLVLDRSDGSQINSFSPVSGQVHGVAAGAYSEGETVSGTVTDGEGNAIESATVELRQSGSVVQSTKTNATGDYQLSSVSDGDYTVRASSSGHQNSSKSITVSGSGVTADLTLPKEGTYVQSFRLDDPTGGFPADETVLELHEYQPGAALNGADPWTRVGTKQLNSEAKASFRLTEGTTYRVTAKNVVPTQRSAEQSWSGFVASSTLEDPYVLETELVLGDWGVTGTATPTSTPLTPTATPAPGATPTPTFAEDGGGGGVPDPNADPDGDGVDNVYDPDDDGDGTPDLDEPDQPSYDSYGPTYLSSCTLPSGEDGARLQYYDPGYNTTQLDYNLTGPDGAVYNGSESFDAPIGLWSECVAETLTNNVTDTGNASIVGNATFENGSVVPLETDFQASGPSFQSFAPMGDPADTPAEQGTAFGLTALGVGASYLASRRTNVLQGLSARSPVDPVFAGGSALSVLMGLEFASGGAVSAATANGVQTVAPLAGLGAVGYGGYWVYTNYIQGQNVTVRGGS